METEITTYSESQLNNKCDLYIADAMKISVIDEDTYLAANSYVKGIKDLIKMISNYWEAPKKNAYSTWKSITEKETQMKKPLQNAEAKLKKEIADYLIIQEDEKQQLEETAAKETGMDVSFKANIPSVKGTSFQDDYCITIEDESKIPFSLNGVQLLKADISAIKKLAKLAKGKIEIPGVKIEKTKIVSVR